ncbi:RagB/SusD family nutrient uptake outer membrane protein [Seonamhaeicola maritimus]|uniref:RagB/SusD family nutrient uptake outer membrane protein n=1 Tax=Seonamhaeicola maritimus TaxID=2591822 RepID=UPI002494635A|nr:RagB/SusD family nutrient uptake outer membrane protein [Seonamhaeicola maritimus]
MKNFNKIKKCSSYFIGFIVLFLTMQSCEEYLEETNPNAVSADVYWSSLIESNSNLTSVYGSMLSMFVLNLEVDAWRSDIGFPKSRRTPFGSGRPYYQKGFTDASNAIGQQWDALYQVAFRTNQVITGLNGMDADLKSQEEWSHQMGQARLFRGLAHMWLNATYNNGNVIIRDFIPGTSDEFSVSVSSSDEVIAFYREDLKYAYDNLPAQFENKTRVDKGFAAALLGKSYLHTEEYTQAMVYLNDVIDNSEYGFELLEGDDVGLLFTHAGDFNSESIFELNYSDKHQVEDSTWDEESFFHRWARYTAPGGGRYGGRTDFVPTAWLTYEYSNEQMDSQDPRNYVDDDSGGVRFRSVPLRCAQFCQVVNDEESAYYGDTPANSAYAFGATIFSHFKKYTNHDIVAGEPETLVTGWKSHKNVVVQRLAEVYLNLAECQIKTGDLAGALENINIIRQRWGLVSLGLSDGSAHDFDEITYTAETLMDHLMYIEYPLELAAEGCNTRTTDLRRWGVAKERFTELATRVYHLANYTSNDGVTRNLSLIQEGPHPTAAPSITNTVMEHRESAENYVEALHDYFPLPLSETLNNQNAN